VNPPSIDPVSSTRHAVLSVQLRSVAVRTDMCNVRYSECVGLDGNKLAQHRTVSVCWCVAVDADTCTSINVGLYHNVQCCASSVAIKMCCVTMLPTAQLTQRRSQTRGRVWSVGGMVLTGETALLDDNLSQWLFLAVSLTRTDPESKLGLRGYRRAATASQQGMCTLQS